ncbi:MAG TPA: hypothetical protein VFQ57_05700 [Sphingomonas sp.]|jgi:Iap family predicted aminopeptidase|nr:hypothetical protein [Sphingomonas sp.]
MSPAVVAALGGAAVLVLAGVAWLVLRPRVLPIELAEDVAVAADASLSGFASAGAVVGADGAAALVVDAHGRVAVCRRLGKQIAVREVPWTAIRATAGGMMVSSGERRFGDVLVAGVDALDVRRLAPHLTRPPLGA